MTDILLDAVHLDERLERLAEADKKNTELLELVKEILTNFDKDKQVIFKFNVTYFTLKEKHEELKR